VFIRKHSRYRVGVNVMYKCTDFALRPSIRFGFLLLFKVNSRRLLLSILHDIHHDLWSPYRCDTSARLELHLEIYMIDLGRVGSLALEVAGMTLLAVIKRSSPRHISRYRSSDAVVPGEDVSQKENKVPGSHQSSHQLHEIIIPSVSRCST